MNKDAGGVWQRFPAELSYSETFNGKLKRDIRIGSPEDKKNVKLQKDPVGNAVLEEYSYGMIKTGNRHYPIQYNEMLQRWIFSYSLPSKFTVRAEGKIRKKGYLVISFRITAFDAAGRAIMHYEPQNPDKGCNMWAMEGQALRKNDYYGTEFEFRNGDVLILNVEESKGDDYLPDHRY